MKIKRWVKNILFTFFFVIPVIQTIDALAQYEPKGEVCGTACGSFIFIIIAVFVLHIALLVWVAKDAKNRGMGSSVGWIFLILLTGVIGLIIYLFSRPQGELVICEVCKNKRFKVARVCPHCGNSSQSVDTRHISRNRTEYCPSCGNKVAPDATFCEECGNKIA